MNYIISFYFDELFNCYAAEYADGTVHLIN
jgi:hypothetical protein